MGARIASFAVGCMACLAPCQALADVATDGTVGQRVSLTGPDFAIDAGLGARAGGNLFHSFERFSIATGESATFSGPADVRNVISRVTGGARSDIDGRLASTIPGADFYFLNPAGVLFGPNASLDVQGSFHVSTADELRFADGAIFSATDPSASSLTIAAPEAFGFLAPDPAGISIERSALQIPAGEAISLVGGEIEIVGGSIEAEAGVVTLAAAGDRATLEIVSGAFDADERAGVTLTDQALIDARGDGGGSVRINAGRLLVSGATVNASNTGTTPAQGAIDITADDVVLDASLVLHHATGSGAGGTVKIGAEHVELVNDSGIGAGSFGEAEAGRIMITSNGRISIDGRGGGLFVNSLSDQPSGGQAGRIELDAAAVDLNEADLQAVTLGGGDSGTIAIESGSLTLSNGAQVAVGPFPGSTGDGGTARLIVAESFVIARGTAQEGPLSGVFADAEPGADGAAGTIEIAAGSLTLEGGRITSVARGRGDGGNIDIHVHEALSLTDKAVISTETFGAGPAGDVTIDAASLTLDDSFIGANSRASASETGDSGAVTVTADRIEFVNDGRIFNGTDGPGDGGKITITAGTIFADVGSDPTRFHTGVSASANTGSSGRGGDVEVTANRIFLTNGGQITSLTRGEGAGGDINMDVRGELILSDKGVISTETFHEGAAGDLTVHAKSVTLNNGFIGANSRTGTSESADAGNVTVHADHIEFVNEGRIFNGTDGGGDGGDVEVRADTIVADGTVDHLAAFHTGISASANAGSSGQGGDVKVTANRIQLINGGEISSDTDASGAAGTVSIVAEQIELSDGGEIFTASSSTGSAGDVSVSAHTLRLSDARISTEADIAGGGRVILLVSQLIDLDQSDITTSVAGDVTTTAGDITIDPRFLILDGSRIIAQAEEGRGGNIRITVDNLIASPDSLISASAGPAGIDGTVVVSSPEIDLTGGLVVLDVPLVDAAALLRERCAARRDEDASSFIGVGRGGLPPSPDQPLLSDYQIFAPVDKAGGGAAAEGEGLLGARTDRGALALAPVMLVQPCTGAL